MLHMHMHAPCLRRRRRGMRGSKWGMGTAELRGRQPRTSCISIQAAASGIPAVACGLLLRLGDQRTCRAWAAAQGVRWATN